MGFGKVNLLWIYSGAAPESRKVEAKKYESFYYLFLQEYGEFLCR